MEPTKKGPFIIVSGKLTIIKGPFFEKILNG